MSNQFVLTLTKPKKSVRLIFGYVQNAEDFATRAKRLGYKANLDYKPRDGKKRPFLRRTQEEEAAAKQLFQEVLSC